jgi:hypothetical protein
VAVQRSYVRWVRTVRLYDKPYVASYERTYVRLAKLHGCTWTTMIVVRRRHGNRGVYS